MKKNFLKLMVVFACVFSLLTVSKTAFASSHTHYDPEGEWNVVILANNPYTDNKNETYFCTEYVCQECGLGCLVWEAYDHRFYSINYTQIETAPLTYKYYAYNAYIDTMPSNWIGLH